MRRRSSSLRRSIVPMRLVPDFATRHRVAGGLHVRGVVPAGADAPGPLAEPTLEEAYLAEVAGDRALRASGFAFLFDTGHDTR